MMAAAFTILHTNDFHNKLGTQQIETIRRLQEVAGEECVLLDAGDAVSAGNVGLRIGGEPILTAMSDLGYAAMALGNREFHISDGIFRHKIGKAKFPILCANMKYRESRTDELPTKSHVVILSRAGLRIGVFGLTVPMVTHCMAARHISAFVFDDPLVVAKMQVDILKPLAEIVIMLSHAGFKTDMKIASAISGLDLVIGGHSHVVLGKAEMSGGCPVVQAGSHGRYVGRVQFAQVDGRWAMEGSELIAVNAVT
jgi:2',3'-cyclic-nucleotide 2'-phosphodiesterase (5'-nucleotidase family)